MSRSRLALCASVIVVTIAAGAAGPSWWPLRVALAVFATAGAAMTVGGVRFAAGVRRVVERAVSRLPYFPDPQARCPAHGAPFCAACARNIGPCLNGEGCEYAADTGMHWDTCEHRVRGRTATGAAARG